MKELIKITENDGKKAVSARDLYKYLGYDDSQFGRYVSSKIITNDFAIEGVDYQQFDIVVDMHNGGKRTIHDYSLSIDFAKKLSMLAKTSNGEQARNYFIECEKKLKKAISIPQSFSEALQLAADQAKQLELQAPKVYYYENVLQSESLITTNQIAKDLGISARKLNKILKELKVQYKQSGTWLLFVEYQGKGYTKTKTHTYTDKEGNVKSSIHTYWTEKGREFINGLIK